MSLKPEDLRVGLVLQLNSGGAPMTVLTWEQPEDGEDVVVSCTWLADGGVQFADDFPLLCLRLANDLPYGFVDVAKLTQHMEAVVADMKKRGRL